MEFKINKIKEIKTILESACTDTTISFSYGYGTGITENVISL